MDFAGLLERCEQLTVVHGALLQSARPVARHLAFQELAETRHRGLGRQRHGTPDQTSSLTLTRAM